MVCEGSVDSLGVDTSFDPISYLYNLQHFGVKLGLDRMARLMEVLGHPHTAFDSVHVAGTNGKGSTCAMLDSVFRASGRKVGFYSSPHLVDFCERIRVDGKSITVDELSEIVLEIKAKLDAYDAQVFSADKYDHQVEQSSEKRDEVSFSGFCARRLQSSRDFFSSREKSFGGITFFEFTTAAAFVYFAKKGVDIAVLEVGLGGRLDATNVVRPLVSVITNIDFDHTKVLGNTKEAIAKEKAGIIKSRVPVVCGEKNSEIVKLFEQICATSGSMLSKVDYEFNGAQSSLDGQQFVLSGKKYHLGLLGRHQIENACVVLKTCEVLNQNGFAVSSQAIETGLLEARWPGRLQVYSKEPLVIFDGAHNLAGMKKLRLFLQDHVGELPVIGKRVCVIGFSTGKDAKEMLQFLDGLFDHVIVTQAGHRAQTKEDVGAAAKSLGIFDTVEVLDLNSAWERALEIVGEDGMILVCGSLYLIGDLMKQLELGSDVLGLSGAKWES